MKKSTHIPGIVAALAALTFHLGLLDADAVPVKFQVDMTGMPGFDPMFEVVDVRGSFNGWSGGYNLVPSANPNILTNTFEITDPAGTQEYFKFTRNGSYELQGSGNRPFTLASGSQVVPLVYFSDIPPASPATTNSITFRVSLSTQVALGNFDPNTDLVYVAGLFQTPYQWDQGSFLQLTNTGTNNLYMGTFTNDGNYPGTYEEFKFIINRFGGNNWESIDNRSFILSNQTILPVVFFNNLGTPIPVTFQVDLSTQAAAGRFLGYEIVECKGSFTGWAGGFVLTNDPAALNQHFYSGTTFVFDGPGSVEKYRFTVNGGFSGLGWETPASTGGNDRSFVVGTNALTLPPVLWSDQTISDLLPAATTVKFTVNMTNAIGTDGHIFDPMVDTLYLNGDWMPWWSWGNPLPNFTLTNDPPGSLTYSLEIPFPQGYAVPLSYKYSINGGDNEAPFGTNHIRYIRTTGQYVLPTDTFGNQFHEISFGNLNPAADPSNKVLLTWVGRPGVRLQSSSNLAFPTLWQDLPGTDGLTATNYPATSSHTYFRLIKP